LAHDNVRPIARVYAAALTEIGRETGTLGAIHDDITALYRLTEAEPWIRHLWQSPRLDRAVKWRAIEAALTGRVGRPILGLMKVLIAKGRESALDNIARQFEHLKDLAENRVHAHVLVARPLADDLRRAIQARLEKECGKTVQIHERVDPAVLGGAAIRVGDRVIDRTFRTRLAALEKQLLKN
jgi:F-type H+-transporting ATPase subunit delta